MASIKKAIQKEPAEYQARNTPLTKGILIDMLDHLKAKDKEQPKRSIHINLDGLKQMYEQQGHTRFQLFVSSINIITTNAGYNFIRKKIGKEYLN